MKGPPVDRSVKNTSSKASAGLGFTSKSAVGPVYTSTSTVIDAVHPESEVTVNITG